MYKQTTTFQASFYHELWPWYIKTNFCTLHTSKVRNQSEALLKAKQLSSQCQVVPLMWAVLDFHVTYISHLSWVMKSWLYRNLKLPRYFRWLAVLLWWNTCTCTPALCAICPCMLCINSHHSTYMWPATHELQLSQIRNTSSWQHFLSVWTVKTGEQETRNVFPLTLIA